MRGAARARKRRIDAGLLQVPTERKLRQGASDTRCDAVHTVDHRLRPLEAAGREQPLPELPLLVVWHDAREIVGAPDGAGEHAVAEWLVRHHADVLVVAPSR